MDQTPFLGKSFLEARARRERERRRLEDALESSAITEPSVESRPAVDLAALHAESRARRGLETPEEAYDRRERERQDQMRLKLLAEQEEDEKAREEERRRSEIRYVAIEEITESILPMLETEETRLASVLSSYIMADAPVERLVALQEMEIRLENLKKIQDLLDAVATDIFEKGGLEKDKEAVFEATTSVENIHQNVIDKIDLLYQTAQEIPVNFEAPHGREIQESLHRVFELATQYFEYPPTEIKVEMDVSRDLELAREIATRSERESLRGAYRPFIPAPRVELDPVTRAQLFIAKNPELGEEEIARELRRRNIDDFSITLALSNRPPDVRFPMRRGPPVTTRTLIPPSIPKTRPTMRRDSPVTTRRGVLNRRRSPIRRRKRTPSRTTLEESLRSLSAVNLKKIAKKVGVNPFQNKQDLIDALKASVDPERLQNLTKDYPTLKSYRTPK